MKRTAFVRLLEKNGWRFLRSGGNHDIFVKGTDRYAVPRHSEIKEGLVRRAVKEKGLK